MLGPKAGRGPGRDARAQFKAGREALLGMTFADFEVKIRDELDRMLGRRAQMDRVKRHHPNAVDLDVALPKAV